MSSFLNLFIIYFQVDMPVFFYIDPEFAEDPKMENVDTITLSYTFFEAKEGMQLPLPGYTTPYVPSQNPAWGNATMIYNC